MSKIDVLRKSGTTKGKQIVGIDFIIPTMPQNDGKNTYKKSGSP